MRWGSEQIIHYLLSCPLLAVRCFLAVALARFLGVLGILLSIVLFTVGLELAFLLLFGSFLAESFLFLLLELLLALKFLLVLFCFLGSDGFLQEFCLIIFLGLTYVLGLAGCFIPSKIDF